MKDTFSGSYSNKTKELIIKQSPLIELFSAARRNAAVEYVLTYVYTKHARPDLTQTLTALIERLRSRKPYEFHHDGRHAPYEVPDVFLEGFMLMGGLDNVGEEDDDSQEDEGPGLEMEDLLAQD